MGDALVTSASRPTQGITMSMVRWFQGALTALFIAGASVAHSQETGFSGFLHRAGAAVSRTATAVTGNTPAVSQKVNPAGATTTGAYLRPVSPVHGGAFEGIFNTFRPGASFPRVALTFLQFGAYEPCWTVRATIWRTHQVHSEETFQICNSPITATDALGNVATVNIGQGLQLANFMLPAQNVEGTTHAPSAPTRGIGPNPPLQLFSVPFTGPTADAFSVQYRQILLRLAWASGYVNPASPDINSTIGKLMWTAGFDPAGNTDRRAP